MKIETTFSIGDVVYTTIFYNGRSTPVEGPLTIGQVRIEITDSPGVDGETLFDNYKAQKRREEGYMCIETGIGSGSVHRVENLFSSYDDAVAAAMQRDELNAATAVEVTQEQAVAANTDVKESFKRILM